MTAFDTVLADVFEKGAEERMTRDEERRQIALAQTGDEDATIALIYAYAPALRAQVSRHSGRLGVEEARSSAILGLMEAIRAFNLRDHSGQLAGIVWPHISNALRGADGGGSVTIPFMARRYYLEIMRAAGGDERLAEELAPSMKMSVDSFRAVREALRVSALTDGDEAEGYSGGRSIDRATPVWVADKDAVRAEVRDMAQEALAAITPKHDAVPKLVDGKFRWAATVQEHGATEELGIFATKGEALIAAATEAASRRDPVDVIRHAYGFVTGEAMSDKEVRRAIAIRELGEDAVEAGESTMSRAKVQRLRTTALAIMKSYLEGVA